MRISIVIPAYNEQYHLPFCLEAISKQTYKPYQVIVVDNNSTDKTAEIALSFNFVKLIRENKQGIVYARDTGFNAASGDLIARIDAETIIPPDWLKKIQKIFISQKYAAVSGSVSYYDAPFKRLNYYTDLFFRSKIAKTLNSSVGYLYGCNMAMERSAWETVRKDTCEQDSLHEDLDLAIHLHKQGYKLGFDKNLKAGISIRSFNTKLSYFKQYALKVPHTYSHHNIEQKQYFYPLVAFVMTAYFPIKIGLRFYNAQTGKFSLNNKWSKTNNPIATSDYLTIE